jgi:aryl sulfotransferase
MLEHCSLEYMRAAFPTSSAVNRIFKDGPRTFFNRGTNGRWRDVLSADEIARCDKISAARLPPDCAHWLITVSSTSLARLSGHNEIGYFIFREWNFFLPLNVGNDAF